MSPELIDAIKQRIKLGHSDENITAELQQAGYERDDIVMALETAKDTLDEPTPIPRSETLPTFQALFTNAWQATVKRYDLILLLVIPLVLSLFVEFIANLYHNSGGEAWLVMIGFSLSILILVAYLVLLFSVMYIVANSKDKDVTVRQSLFWTKRKIWGLIFVNILTSLATLGGFILFVIPGLIVTIYLYLSQFVYIKEEQTGLKALARSRQLVKGNWWYVAGKLVALMLVMVIIMIFAGLVASLAFDPDNLSDIENFMFGLVSNIFGAFVTVFSLFFTYNIYEALSTKKVSSEESYDNVLKFGYGLLMLIGTLLIATMVASMYTFWQNDPEQFRAIWEQEEATFIEEFNSGELKNRAQNLD